MAKDLIELFNAGGLPLVLVAGFIIALLWAIKYFVRQIDAAAVERKGLIEQANVEKTEMFDKFDRMLNNHCQMVTEALNKQATVFEHLIDKIDTLVQK